MTRRRNPAGCASRTCRWPVQPLVDFYMAKHQPRHVVRIRGPRVAIAGRELSVAADDTIGDIAADTTAVMLGVHPSLIWTDWFEPVNGSWTWQAVA